MKGRISSEQRIRHMVEAIERIESFVAGMSESQFEADQRTVFACVRGLEILGEASWHVSNDIKEAYPQVDWQDAVALRNFVAHQYFATDTIVLWKAIKQHLPLMKTQLQQVLQALSA